jgi:hypothetical protein
MDAEAAQAVFQRKGGQNLNMAIHPHLMLKPKQINVKKINANKLTNILGIRPV